VALFDLLSRSENDTLVIPQLVIDEETNKCREAIAKIQHVLKQQLQEFQRWTGEGLSLPVTDDKVQSTIATYEQTLKDTLLRTGATIRSYPTTSHEQLVAKCLARKRPFSEDRQKGYRDALIWESILEILVEDEVAFITNNSNDFFEKDKLVLHPHLLEDLLRDNIDANQITVFKDLHSFVDVYVKPTMETLDLESVRSDLSFGLGRYDKEVIADAILQALNSYDYGDEIQPHEIGLPSEVETVTVSYVEDLSDFHTVDAHKLSSGAWFIEATATFSYQFDFFIFKADWYAMEEEAPIVVIDSDWNDHYIFAQAMKPIQVSFTLTFDESTGTVTSIEVNAFASVFPYR
jgi:hypothetical protein